MICKRIRICIPSLRCFATICYIAAAVILLIHIPQQQRRPVPDAARIENVASNLQYTSKSPVGRPVKPAEVTDYVVYNPRCKIPDYPEFHQDVLPYYKKKEDNCTSKPLLTSVTRSGSGFIYPYILNLHPIHSPHYVKDDSTLVCCYSEITIDTNETLREGKCQTLESNATLSSTAVLVQVICKNERNAVIYKVHHFLVNDNHEVRRKTDQLKTDNNRSDEFVSVMLVGLDSVSRLNLLRMMPETAKYLQSNGWYTFPAYHKVQRNTFYNLNGPVLTGLSGDQLRSICIEKHLLDSCPFIWKNFSERNYITAYGEDAPEHDSFFNIYMANRFTKHPTDYYLRPRMLNTQLAFRVNGWATCIGPKSPADYILDFSADFASSFVNYPTFSLFWLNTGHNDLNAPQVLDKKFIRYFSSLENSGVLNRSVIVFLSDHGLQFTNFRSTYMGFVEDSMPFLYVWLPKWFKEKYPSKAENLARNKHRLISHFDTYLTLMDVLGVKTKAAGCPKCVSLFDPVPWNRNCSDAGISRYSCICDSSFKDIPADGVVEKMAQLVAAHINKKAAAYAKYLQKGYKCSNITLKKVDRARQAVAYWGKMYAINLETAPNSAKLEAIVTGRGRVVSLTEYTEYGPRSYCMNAREGKMWCTCELEGVKATAGKISPK